MSDEQVEATPLEEAAPNEPGPDEPVLTLQQHDLVRRALPEVAKRAKQVARRYGGRVGEGDLTTIGKLAVYRLIQRFEGELCHDVVDHAGRRAQSAMLDAVRVEGIHAQVQKTATRAGLQHTAFRRDDWDGLTTTGDEVREKHRKFLRGTLWATFAAGVAEADRASPEEELAAKEEYARAIEALDTGFQRLPAPEREVIALLYGEMLMVDEAAERLGVTGRTVQRREERALEMLRKVMEAAGVVRAPAVVEGGRKKFGWQK